MQVRFRDRFGPTFLHFAWSPAHNFFSFSNVSLPVSDNYKTLVCSDNVHSLHIAQFLDISFVEEHAAISRDHVQLVFETIDGKGLVSAKTAITKDGMKSCAEKG